MRNWQIYCKQFDFQAKEAITCFSKSLVLLVLCLCSTVTYSQNNDNSESKKLTETEILLIYEKSSDAIENFLFYLNAFKESEISDAEAQIISQEIEKRFTEKANIYADLNAEIVDFESSPTTSINISDYLVQFRGISGIKSVLSNREELGYEMTPIQFDGVKYMLRVSFNKEINGVDRNKQSYIRTKQLATIFVEKSENEYSALIQEISFIKPNEDYGFLPESASKAIRDAAFAKIQMKRSGIDSLYKIDDGALNTILNTIASELTQNQNLYGNYIQSAKHYLALQDLVAAYRELEKARKIQPQGVDYKSLSLEVAESLENRARNVLSWTKSSMSKMEFERVEKLIAELINLGVEQTALATYSEQAKAGIEKWKMLSGVGGTTLSNEALKVKLNGELASGKYANQADSLAVLHTAIAQLIVKENNKSTKVVAQDHLAKAIKAMPDYTKAKLLQLEIEFSAKSAIETYTQLLSKDANNEDWYLLRSRQYEDQKELKLAIADLEKAVTLWPLNEVPRRKLANLYLQANDYPSALKHYKILKILNKEALNSVFITYAYLELNYLDSAEIENDNYQAYSFPQLDSIAINYYDNAVRNMGYAAYAEAAAIFDKLVILVGHQKEYSDYWFTGAECHYNLKNNDKAQEFLLRSIGVHPSHFEANVLNGKIYMEQNEYALAKETFEKCLEIRKNDFSVTMLLGDTYFKEGKYYSEASIYYTRALKIAEEDKSLKDEIYRVRVQLAKCARMMDKLDYCVNMCDEAIKLNSDAPDAYFEQGMALGKKPEESQVKKGLKQIEKALELNFDQAECFRAMAELYLALRDYEDALEELNKLERISKFTANDFIMQSKAFDGLEKPTDALSNLNKAMKEDSSLSGDYKFLIQLSIVRIKHGNATSSPKDIEDSKITIDNAFRNNREEPTIFLAYSLYYWYMNDKAKAVENIKTAMTYNLNVSAAENDPFIKEFLKNTEIKQVIKQN